MRHCSVEIIRAVSALTHNLCVPFEAQFGATALVPSSLVPSAIDLLERASAIVSSPKRAQDLALDLLVRELQNLSDREFVFIEGYPRNLEELNTFQDTVRSNAEH